MVFPMVRPTSLAVTTTKFHSQMNSAEISECLAELTIYSLLQ